MIIFVFGNEDVKQDSLAITVAKKLTGKIPGLEFKEVLPNEDLPFVHHDVILMDVIKNIKDIIIISDKDLEKIILPAKTTVHDFDLGFQIKYLKKLGKLDKVTIIGLPISGKINYSRIQSIFKKLVEQDMQGS